ncbi:MAG: SDR family NAD(P)-dependent oxidoreductase [Acidobacteriota bacterium]
MSLFDRLLDASILFSFDRSGFERHASDFDPDDLRVDLGGRRMLVTGANAGLGRVAALHLASLGAEVWLLCRSRERGTAALDDLRFATGNDTLRLEVVDISRRDSVRAFAERLGSRPVDALIHNAGILPHERRLVDDGPAEDGFLPHLESTWATNVVGPHLLTWLLVPNLRAAHEATGRRARVINVTSGGMYTQKLDLSDIAWQERDFAGVVAYAQTKRAEVVLTEQWAQRLEPLGIDVVAMHPGWADTGAVREALPRFHRLMAGRLRDPRQGADTMVWLAAADAAAGHSGRLFFDRRVVDTHLLPGTRAEPWVRERLWTLCREQAGLAAAVAPWHIAERAA